MIVNTDFLRQIVPLFSVNLLKAGYARVVCTWILDYWNRFKEAPQKNIQEIYNFEKAKIQDEDEAENLAQFLRKLSQDWVKSQIHNLDFSIKQSIHYLKVRSIELLSEQLESALLEGDPVKAEHHLTQFKRVEKLTGEGVSILKDVEKIITAFAYEEEELFKFPGALGDVVGSIKRGDFFSFLAPMKRGKTWWLIYAAIIALSFGLKVILFSLEMTERQVVRRVWQSLTGEVRDAQEAVKLPYFDPVEIDGESRFVVKHREVSRNQLDTRKVEAHQKRFRRMFRSGDFRIVAMPSNSVTVEDLVAHLDTMKHFDDWTPDVVLIDYADIIAPSRGFRGEYRHQLDDIWKKLRALGQARFCAVGTASQAEKSTFTEDVSPQHVSEDIRKLAHVTSMLGLNQTKDEAEMGVMRVSQLAVREGKQSFQQAYVLQCLDLGRPAIDSRLRDQVIEIDEDEDDDDEIPKKRSRTRGR